MPNLQPASERGREVIEYRKIPLPTGYTILVFTTLGEYDDPTDTRVSVYPPGSDCQDKEDRVAQLHLWSQDFPAFLAMCGHTD